MKSPFRHIFFLFLCCTAFAFPLFGQSREKQSKEKLERDLYNAIDKYDFTAAAGLLEKGADPNGYYKANEKRTFLMQSGYYVYNIKLMHLLLDYGADPNLRDSEGNIAAHYINDSKPESTEKLKLLAAKGARFDVINKEGVSPLLAQLNRNSHVTATDFLLDWEEKNSPEFSANFPSRKDYYEAIFRRLQEKYYSGENNDVLSIAERLLNAGADPKVRDENGRTAVYYGNAQIAALLASRGLRFDVMDKDGKSPLLWLNNSQYQKALFILEWEEQHSPHFSARYENRKDYLTYILENFMNYNSLGSAHVQTATALIEKLIDGGADITTFRYFSSLAREAQFIIPSLIERGVPISAFTRYDETLLYNAADKNNEELVTYLLGKGVDPNEQGKTGETALMADTNARIISLLIKAGANINLVDEYGGTALMRADRRDTALLLLNAGAEPTLKNLRGRTVLHYWGWRLDKMPLDEVLSRGCLIDEPDNNGITPLMNALSIAVEYEDHEAPIAALLKRRADPNLRDPQGRNALHRYLAEVEKHGRVVGGGKIYGFEAITEMLLAAGARPSDTDDEGETALLVALRLAGRYERMAALRDILLQNAPADEVKIAQSAAKKTVAQERRKDFGSDLAYSLPRIMGALSFPLTIGGLSIGMQVAYRDNPSNNFMGMINGVLDFTTGGMLLGALLFYSPSNSGFDWLGSFLGGIIFGGVGLITGFILTALIPSIAETVNNNPLLYYLPTVASAVIATFFIVKLRY